MPFERPTLPELVNQIRADFLSRVSVGDVLKVSDIEVQARVAAGAVWGLYGYADWMARQCLPDTAETDVLDRWASIWLDVPRKPAAAATGVVTITAQAGAVVPAGAQVVALDGRVFELTAAAAGTVPTLTAPVRAVVAGVAANRAAGQTMMFVSPIAGVQATVMASAMSSGADAESDDDLRLRVLAAIRAPAQGGSAGDYVAWALEVPGITRAWCSAGEMGSRSVVVRVVRDGDAVITPDAAALATVKAHIELVRPVTDQVYVLAPTLVPVNFNISGLSPNTSAVQAAVTAELADLIRREAKPGGSLLLSHMRAAISQAAGEDDYVLVSPSAVVTMAAGQMASMGVVTWV